MIELSEANVEGYLRESGRVAAVEGESGGTQAVLVQALSGGVANVVLKIFDSNAGLKVGTDMRTPAQMKRGVADKRMNLGACFVLKQPLPKFKTEAEWLVDIDRMLVERDCMGLLGELLPAGSVPEVLWFDAANYILAMSCAPLDAVIWKKQLLAGRVSSEAAMHAGMLLAIMHSSTKNDKAVRERFGDDKYFIQQRTDPYFATLVGKHPDLKGAIEGVIRDLLHEKHCLIHGDFSPKNIFVVPAVEEDVAEEVAKPKEGPGALAPGGLRKRMEPKKPRLAGLMLLDFEVAYYGHCGFDIATLINHLLLKAFYLGKPWRACMIAIDAFWQTYLHTADMQLAAIAEKTAGRILGGLLLARVDGKSPAEYLQDEKFGAARESIRNVGREILAGSDAGLEPALDLVANALQKEAS